MSRQPAAATSRFSPRSIWRALAGLACAKRLAASLICFVALAGLYYIDSRQRGIGQMNRWLQSGLLPREIGPENRDKLTKIELEIAGKQMRVVLERDPARTDPDHPDEGWMLVVPERVPAWSAAMSVFTQRLLGAKRRNEFAGVPEPGNGLDFPTARATFTYDGAAGSPLEILFGIPSTYNGEVFAQASDRPGMIFTVNKVLFEMLSQKPGNYIDSRVIGFPPGRITTMELRNAYGEIVVTATGPGTWALSGDMDGEADPFILKVFSEDIAKDKMASAKSDPAKPVEDVGIYLAFGDGKTTRTLTIEKASSAEIDGMQYHRAIRNDFPNEFFVDGRTYDALTQEPLFFRNRHFFAFDPAKALAYRVSHEGGSMILKRDAPTDPWHWAARPKRPLRQKHVGNALEYLAGLRAQGYFRKPESMAAFFAEGDPVIEVDYLEADGAKTTRKLRLSRRTPSDTELKTYVQPDDEPIGIAVPIETTGFVWLRGNDVLEKAIARGRAGDLVEFAFHAPLVEAAFKRRDPATPGGAVRWTCEMKRPTRKSGPVEDPIMIELLNQLAGLQFERLALLQEERDVEHSGALPDFRLLLKAAGGELVESAVVYNISYPSGESPARLSDETFVVVDRGPLIELQRAIQLKVMPYLDLVEPAPDADAAEASAP